MPGLICEIRHFVVPQGVAASCSGVFQALTGELAGYLRFKGVIFGRRNIYLHFRGCGTEASEVYEPFSYWNDAVLAVFLLGHQPLET